MNPLRDRQLAVVAYPELDAADRQWIESFRAEHDPQADRIDVHFTLVFPADASSADVGPELAAVARSTRPIVFIVRRAEAVADVLSSGSHLFLVPDEGGASIATLHDRLYTGTLKAHLRADIPFVPHMTIAAAPDSTAASRLVPQIDARLWPVRGSVRALTLLDVGPQDVRSVATYMLTGR